tara:strand:- start:503 stop:1885 length:1383 start_codon:yes stop_codon:yes gene_type:complete
MNSIPVLVEAKKEYTNQLQQIVSPRLYEGFKSIYNDILKVLSDEMIEGNHQSSSVTKLFQKSIKDIPLWNNEMIKNEYNRIEKISNCDYIENLIEAVFITNTKILTSVQINSNESLSIKINVPQPQHFIHKCYIECSKEIYKNPYIFDMSKNLTPKEKHSNLRESLSIINHSISNAIRDLLPIRDILKQGLLNETSPPQVIQESKQIINNEEEEETQDFEQESEENNIDEVAQDDSEEEQEYKNDEEDNDNSEEYNENENNEVETENNQEEINLNNEETKIIKLDESEINLVDENNLTNIGNQQSNIINIENNNDDLQPKLFGGLNNQSNLKEINLNKNHIVKKIDNVEKIEKMNISSHVERDIEDFTNPISTNDSSNLINVNSNIRKINQRNFIKKRLLGTNKINNSFYQKKYDENLANYNYTSESYLDDDDNKNISKNNINVDYNSSDDEDSNPIELV